MEHAFTNELINETSPYLLQHAHNPVQWHPWSEAALKKAKDQDKPILVSIGYAACHWCHVMERESFENEQVAEYMNAHFINIKIDREERPDLDHIYMEAVQAIAGNGGWPLNVFLTTDARPFYGGTYFPPEKAFNRASWMDVLSFMTDNWKNKRDEVEQQASTLMDHITKSNQFIAKMSIDAPGINEVYFNDEQCKMIRDNILKTADTLHGGFGNAPKFPQTFSIQFLLAYSAYFKDEQALVHAELSLQKMLDGGIYDHLAGGMARYSTDALWLAPHFEKMLYDNALLVMVLCDAFQVTGNDYYKSAIEKTLQFLINEMQDAEGGFYAALDADSEGVEGKFYVWEKEEIERLLGKDSEMFCEWYGVTKAGNWEHANILHVNKRKTEFAQENNIEVEELNTRLHNAEKMLLQERNKRIRPATDDKILLGWNALLLTAFCRSAAALGKQGYTDIAVKLFDFIKAKYSKNGQVIFHSYKNNVASHPAFLDDYAYLIQSAILLQELTSRQEYLTFAGELTEYVILHFQDSESGFFFYTNKDQPDAVARKQEIYDNATPSGNSVMAENLFYLSLVFNNPDWSGMALRMLNSLSEVIIKYPTSFGIWANLALKQVTGVKEIMITGKNADLLVKEILKLYLPAKVLQSSETEINMPLLKDKVFGKSAVIYVCKNYSCSAPVKTIDEFMKLL